MGRRATSTTKSGKYMNPADQQRKEARKKELKKNKKTRQLVRHAVLKNKRPEEVIFELEKIDAMEFDTDPDRPKLHEKVILEKRRKLTETYHRLLGLYYKEDRELWTKMKKDYTDYEKRKRIMEENFNAVKFANEADPAEIPLPDNAPPGFLPPPFFGLPPGMDIPLPSDFPPFPIPPLLGPPSHKLGLPTTDPPTSILKKRASEPGPAIPPKKRREPIGPPPGTPPELTDSEGEESGSSEDEKEKSYEGTGGKKKIRFNVSESQQQEGEKDTRSRYKELAKKMAVSPGFLNKNAADDDDAESSPAVPSRPPGYPVIGPVLMRPPPGTTGPPGHQRMRAPPPPPGGLPPSRPGGMMGGGRMPPPPPRFPPPHSLRPGMSLIHAPQGGPSLPGGPPGVRNSVAEPTASEVNAKKPPRKAGATIEAKPQLRNVTADLTRLVPTSVKIGRNPAEQKKAQTKPKTTYVSKPVHSKPIVPEPQRRTKDDAYAQFMKEMESFL